MNEVLIETSVPKPSAIQISDLNAENKRENPALNVSVFTVIYTLPQSA